jgi:hypothetical protein
MGRQGSLLGLEKASWLAGPFFEYRAAATKQATTSYTGRRRRDIWMGTALLYYVEQMTWHLESMAWHLESRIGAGFEIKCVNAHGMSNP